MAAVCVLITFVEIAIVITWRKSSSVSNSEHLWISLYYRYGKQNACFFHWMMYPQLHACNCGYSMHKSCITFNGDVCTVPTAVVLLQRQRWLQLMLMQYTYVTELISIPFYLLQSMYLRVCQLSWSSTLYMHKTWLGFVYAVYIA